MNYKYALPTILGALLVVAAVWFSLSHRIAQTTPLVATSSTPADTITTAPSSRIPSAIVHQVPPKKTTITLPITASSTVIEAMKAYATTGAITYTTEQYPSLGLMVTSINGLKNDSSHYWFLYINGTSASVGASTAQVGPSDTVEWRYEKNY